jgi:hypothetical protein
MSFPVVSMSSTSSMPSMPSMPSTTNPKKKFYACQTDTCCGAVPEWGMYCLMCSSYMTSYFADSVLIPETYPCLIAACSTRNDSPDSLCAHCTMLTDQIVVFPSIAENCKCGNPKCSNLANVEGLYCSSCFYSMPTCDQSDFSDESDDESEYYDSSDDITSSSSSSSSSSENSMLLD